ncbi:MAG: winged helix-turn-helix transcriptional regulator [Opitutaceae bacterium]|nr:winged helix-turn-helix transcriptional regulator [Opitutaceae bacterium]
MPPSTPTLDARFAALADGTRRAILARLATGEGTVQELAEPFDISLPAISKHLKVLEKAGLITRRRDAQRRPCRLRPEALSDITAWAEATRRTWEERFDRLEDYLQRLQSPTKTKKQKSIHVPTE